jgi:uncharacterized protein
MFNYLLLKLASRCNFDCTYCYWFRDGSVRALPALMGEEVIAEFLAKLHKHIASCRLSSFTCSFHGGEPTLFGLERFRKLLQRIDAVAERTRCDIRYALTTNGALIDKDWAQLLRQFEVSVTVSIDGPPSVHNARRVGLKGQPTWQDSVNGYLNLCRTGIAPSIIAVCDPSADPRSVLDHLVRDLGSKFCDFLVPDQNHEEDIQSIAPFYIGLFDHWYDNYADQGVEVRFLSDCIRGLLGLQSRTESIGFAPTQTVCLNSNGKLEPHDVLRIAGAEFVDTACSIFSHDLAEIEDDPLWRSVKTASTSLCQQCESCRYRTACGGGHVAQRWSKTSQYDNPSVYCADYLVILDHIAGRLKDDIEVMEQGGKLDPQQVLAALTAGEPSRIFAPAGTSL